MHWVYLDFCRGWNVSESDFGMGQREGRCERSHSSVWSPFGEWTPLLGRESSSLLRSPCHLTRLIPYSTPSTEVFFFRSHFLLFFLVAISFFVCSWVWVGFGRCVDENFVPVYQVSKEKAKKLGLEYTPIEVSLKETVESLKEKKFASLWVVGPTMKLSCQNINKPWSCYDMKNLVS